MEKEIIMKEYRIQRVSGPFSWDDVPALEVNESPWCPDFGIRMTQQVCYDDEALYVRQCAVEPLIRAEEKDTLSPVWEDSCMEFYFTPGNDGRYMNLEVNPNGCYATNFGSGRYCIGRLVPCDPDQFHIETERTAEGWELRYRFPYSWIRLFFPDFAPAPGKILRANVYKCGRKTEHPHFISWNPIPTAAPDFHTPQYFGKMIFS